MDTQTIKMDFIPAIVELWAKNQGRSRESSGSTNTENFALEKGIQIP